MNKILLSSFFTLILVLINLTSVYSEEFRWPLDSKTALSASFMEYRGGHFHAGIDIKTARKTGLRVKSPFDGFISWIHVDETSYGRMMEITGDNGLKTRFGHLKSFNGGKYDLDRKIIDYRLKNFKRYPVDLFFGRKEYRVKKGETVCLSGGTGAGPPHLHYELRKKNTLLDPLYYHEKIIRDRVKPVYKNIILVPEDHDSLICGRDEETVIPLTGTDVFKVAVKGRFSMYLNCFDRIEKSPNKVGVSKITVKINGEKHLEYSFKRLKHDNRKKTSAVFNRRRSNLSACDYVYYLSHRKRIDNEFASFTGKTGLFEFKEKTEMEIKISDKHGNSNTKKIIFIPSVKEKPQFKHKGSSKRISLYSKEKGFFILQRNNNEFKRVKYTSSGKWITVKTKKSVHSVYFYSDKGMFSVTKILSNIKVKEKIDFYLKNRSFRIIAYFKDKLRLLKPVNKEFGRTGVSRQSLVLSENILRPGINEFVFETDGKKIRKKINVNDGRTGILSSIDGAFKLNFSRTKYNKPGKVFIYEKESHVARGFKPVISKTYCIRPVKFKISGKMEIIITDKKIDNRDNRTGICRNNGYPGFASTGKVKKHGLTTKIWSGGDFSVYRDNSSPRLKGKTGYSFSSFRGEELIPFKLSEKGSGVPRENIRLIVDGKKRDFDYFSQDKKINVPVLETDEGGWHEYVLTVKDRCGNTAVKSGKYRISGKKRKRTIKNIDSVIQNASGKKIIRNGDFPVSKIRRK